MFALDHKHKVLRSYSPAEENAGSLYGPQDDDFDVGLDFTRLFQTDHYLPLPRLSSFPPERAIMSLTLNGTRPDNSQR